MNQIVEDNLSLMRNNERGGMQRLLRSESVGGNSGHWYNLPCAGANFYYNPQTGEIVYFENIPPRGLPQNSERGSFRVALFPFVDNDERFNFKQRILSVYAKPGNASVQDTLEETVRAYNQQYAFNSPLAILSWEAHRYKCKIRNWLRSYG